MEFDRFANVYVTSNVHRLGGPFAILRGEVHQGPNDIECYGHDVLRAHHENFHNVHIFPHTFLSSIAQIHIELAR